MAYYGEKRLGTPVQGNDIDAAFEAAGLNWGTVLRPAAWKNLKTGEFQEIENRYAVVRTDNGAVVDVGVSSQFHTHHNRVVADLLKRVGRETGAVVTHLNEVQNTIIAYADIPGLRKAIVGKGDIVSAMLRITFPHASGRSIRTGIELKRLICTNGAIATERAGSITSHRTDFTSDVARICKLLTTGLVDVEKLMMKMRQLAETEAKAADVRRWVHELTTGERVLRQAIAGTDQPDTDGASVLDSIVQEATAASLTTDQMNRAGRAVLDAITNSPGWDTAPGTWWAAVNGATYYYEHRYGRSAETRLAANALGGVAEKQKQTALDLAVQYAGI